MAAYDGSIVIDTLIDALGFNQGVDDLEKRSQKTSTALGSLMNTLKGVAAAIGIAFGTAAVVKFVETAIGSFSLLSSNFGRELMSLKWAMLGLQGAIVNALAPAFAAIYPYILGAIHYLTQLFQTISQISLAFFGLAGSINAAKLAQLEMNKAVGAGALAGFDQLNVLNAKPMLPGVNLDPAILKDVEDFKNKILDFLKPAITAFNNLKTALEPLGKTIWDGLKWAWDNILVPFGNWVGSKVVPAFLDTLGTAAGTVNIALITLKPLGIWLWDNFLKPAAEWTGQAILDALKWLTDRLNDLSKWIKDNPESFRTMVEIIIGLAVAIWLVNAAVTVWLGISALATIATTTFAAAAALLSAPVVLTILAIIALIAIIALLIIYWPQVSAAAVAAWDWIVQAWNNAVGWISTDPIRKAFESFLAWLPDSWRVAFDGVIGFVKGAVNTIIDFINTMIMAIGNGINFVIGALNSTSITIPDWVPGIGGQTWGYNIPLITPFQIPRLAMGGVIPPNAQFAAILGDQTSGRNIEAPESLMRQIIAEEIGKVQAEITIRFEGTMAQFVQQLKPVLDRENVRIGGNLVQGVVKI